MPSNASAYYLWPAVWVGSRPPETELNVDLTSIDEEMYRTALPGGITARVLREGLFIFDFSDSPSGRAIDSSPSGGAVDFDILGRTILYRVMVLNAHLACLYSAIGQHQNMALEKMALSPSDLINLQSFEDNDGGVSDPRLMSLWLTRYSSTYAQNIPNRFDWRLSLRHFEVEVDTIRISFDLLGKIIDHNNPQSLVLADLFTRSCKAFQDHAYGLSLITSWSVIESLLQRLWSGYIEANRTRQVDGKNTPFINKARKDKLMGRDFTASVVSEALSLVNLLPYELYQALSRVRADRNNWIHGLQSVSRKSATESISTAELMLDLVDGIRLHASLTSKLPG